MSDRKSYEMARERGRQAFRNGSKEAACPYRAGTMTAEREAWMRGFHEAKAERQRKVAF